MQMRSRFRSTLPLVVSLVAAAMPGAAAAAQESPSNGPKRQVICPEQIEADWLRQDAVRALPPAEPYRAPFLAEILSRL